MGNSTINTIQIKRGRYPEGGFTRELKPYELGWTTNEVTDDDITGKTLYIQDGGKIEGVIKNYTFSFHEVSDKPEIIVRPLEGDPQNYSGATENAFIPIGGYKFKEIIKGEISEEILPKIEEAKEEAIETAIIQSEEYTNLNAGTVFFGNTPPTESSTDFSLEHIIWVDTSNNMYMPKIFQNNVWEPLGAAFY